MACSLGRTALVALLVLLVFGSLSTASAHYKDAKLEIYKAITTPVIDGTYNMTLKQVALDGRNVTIDEWNDAAWIEIPAISGNVTVYSGFKYDGSFMYIVYDVHYAGTGGAYADFDPRHDGATNETKWDNFRVMFLAWKEEGFRVAAAFPQRSSKYWYGCCDQCSPCKPRPRGLLGNASITPSPLSSAPHRIYEMRVPLWADLRYGRYDLRTAPQGTFGIVTWVMLGQEPRDGFNASPPIDFPLTITVYADATFSNRTNPSLTVPPTVVPEFPIQTAPLVAVTALATAIIVTRKAKPTNFENRRGFIAG